MAVLTRTDVDFAARCELLHQMQLALLLRR